MITADTHVSQIYIYKVRSFSYELIWSKASCGTIVITIKVNLLNMMEKPPTENIFHHINDHIRTNHDGFSRTCFW